MTTERILACCSFLLTVAMLLAWPEAQPMMAEGYTLRYDVPSSQEAADDASAEAGLEDGDGCTLDEEGAAVCELAELQQCAQP